MRARFHDTAADATANALRLAGLRVAREVGVLGGRIDIDVLDNERWAWALEIKVTSHQLLTAPKQLRNYVDITGHDTAAATLIVPAGLASPELEAKAQRENVDLWTCDFRALVDVISKSVRPPAHTFVHLPAQHPETTARVIEMNRAYYQRYGNKASYGRAA